MNETYIIAACIVAAVVFLTGTGIWYRWWIGHAGKYFLRWASDDYKTRLRAASIPFEEGTIEAGDELGIFVKAKYLERVCSALSAYVVTKFKIEKFRTHELVLRPVVQLSSALEQFSVVTGVPTEARDMVKRIVSESLLPSVKANIFVHTAAARHLDPIHEAGVLHVFLGASSAVTENKNTPARLLGVDWNDLINPVPSESGNGLPLVEPHTGFAYGEICGNSVFIFCSFGEYKGANLALLSRLLDLCAVELNIDKLVDDALASVTLASAPPAPANLCVYEEGFEERRLTIVKAMLQRILMPVVRSDIHIKDCGGKRQEALDDGMFHIFYGSQPALSGGGSLPSGYGLPITDQSGLLLGELAGSNLFLYQGMLKFGNQREVLALAKFFAAANNEIAVERSENPDEEHAQRYAAVCVAQVRAVGKVNAAKAIANQQATEEALRQLMVATRAAEQDVLRLENGPENELGQEFDLLFKVKQVTDVKVTDTEIVVHTKVINCRDERTGKWHRLGAYEVHIPIGGSSPRIFRKEGPQQVAEHFWMNAPHVDNEGKPCLGNIKDMFPELITKREFASLVQLCIAFLEQANTDDNWGKYVHKWPEAPELN